MLAYIARRILLMIPTVFGIMLVSFVIVQFAPGGPVERVIAQLQGLDERRVAPRGGGAESAAGAAPGGSRRREFEVPRRPGSRPEVRQGARTAVRLRQTRLCPLRPHGEELRRIRFRPELLPRRAGPAADPRAPARLDLARPLDDAAVLRDLDPARHRQGGAGRVALRRLEFGDRDDRLCGAELPLRHPAHHPVRGRVLLPDLPAARPRQRELGRPQPGRTRSPTISGTSRCRSSPCRSEPSRPRPS